MNGLLIVNAHIVDAYRDIPCGWIAIEETRIADYGTGVPPERFSRFDNVIDAKGGLLMPGVIDEHVHFREPGMTFKGDMESESAAAAAGGVTTFFDMPNTKPATTTHEAWQEKMDMAQEKCFVNYAFFVGATSDNMEFLVHADYTRIPGIKLFMGATTGTDATNSDEFLERLFECVPAIIAVHAEDEETIKRNRERILHDNENPSISLHSEIRSEDACVIATRKIVSIAKDKGKRLHVMHVSTAAELEMFSTGPVDDKQITCETCPQYLIFDSSDYERSGSRIKCNPSIKDARNREALTKALFTGKIDTIATDHAPHLLADKAGNALTAASGMPGIQFSLLLMLELAKQLDKKPSDVSRIMSCNPTRLWKIQGRGLLEKGYYADMVLVRETEQYNITDDMVISKCGWTPYAGQTLYNKIAATWVNGNLVYDETNGIARGSKCAMPVIFG